MLNQFKWNNLFDSPDERAFARYRIRSHFYRFALAERGVDMANVWYVFFESYSFTDEKPFDPAAKNGMANPVLPALGGTSRCVLARRSSGTLPRTMSMAPTVPIEGNVTGGEGGSS